MHRWQDDGLCVDFDTNLYFETYEEEPDTARAIDARCRECPVNKRCLSWAVSNNEYGCWAGIYFENGKISKDLNAHKTEQDWFDTWQALTMEQDVY